MATRSAIGYATPEGKVRAKYCHYDGYVAGVGRTLQEHYQEARKIAQLVELGDQSTLYPEIFPTVKTHSFDTPQEGVSVFYGRDRGEDGVEAKEFDTVQEFVDHYIGAGCEYFYLHTATGWVVHDRYVVYYNTKNTTGHVVFKNLEVEVETAIKRLQADGHTV